MIDLLTNTEYLMRCITAKGLLTWSSGLMWLYQKSIRYVHASTERGYDRPAHEHRECDGVHNSKVLPHG